MASNFEELINKIDRYDSLTFGHKIKATLSGNRPSKDDRNFVDRLDLALVDELFDEVLLGINYTQGHDLLPQFRVRSNEKLDPYRKEKFTIGSVLVPKSDIINLIPDAINFSIFRKSPNQKSCFGFAVQGHRTKAHIKTPKSYRSFEMFDLITADSSITKENYVKEELRLDETKTYELLSLAKVIRVTAQTKYDLYGYKVL